MIDRREFLRKASLGTLALGTLSGFLHDGATPALAQSQRGFMFLAVSSAGEGAGRHMIAMGGRGVFDPSKGPASPVEGGGSFFHFQPAASAPFPLVGSGTWKARLLSNYREIGSYGGAAAGIGAFVIDLHRIRPSPAVFRGAVLTIYCNLGPAGLQTGEIEGYTLSIPGTDFSAGGTLGPFRQIPPGGVGLTVFQLTESLG